MPLQYNPYLTNMLISKLLSPYRPGLTQDKWLSDAWPPNIFVVGEVVE
jgi:hypothetical protein